MKQITKEYLEKLDKEIIEDEELEFIPLTFDYALKSITAKNQKIFRKFIIQTTHLENITDNDKMSFLDKELIKSTAKEQAREVDFYLKIGNDILIDVEMNRKGYKYVKERNAIYIAKLITLKLEVNTSYQEMKKKEFYQVNINGNESKDDILPGREKFTVEEIKIMEDEFDSILSGVLEENNAILSSCWKEKTDTLLKRCIKYKAGLLFYIHDFSVPYDNNFMDFFVTY